MTNNNGGPAFPTDSERQVGPDTYHFGGMTLRDWFAGQALAGLRVSGPVVDPGLYAMLSYQCADSMLVAREPTSEDADLRGAKAAGKLLRGELEVERVMVEFLRGELEACEKELEIRTKAIAEALAEVERLRKGIEGILSRMESEINTARALREARDLLEGGGE